MIDKILHFIWLGSEIPRYAKNCIDVFHKVNPDFEINFIHENNPYNSSNCDVNEILELIEQENTFFNLLYNRKWAMKHLYGRRGGNMSNIADCLKFYLVNKYGGIYLDLDTFPVKPFDERILSHENFIVKSDISHIDYFFMGSTKKKRMEDFYYYKDMEKFDCQKYKFNEIDENTDYFISYYTSVTNIFSINKKKLQKKFIDGNLKYGSSIIQRKDLISDYYIDHYRIQSWLK